jgi:putative SOS response-associated peptidase YedK
MLRLRIPSQAFCKRDKSVLNKSLEGFTYMNIRDDYSTTPCASQQPSSFCFSPIGMCGRARYAKLSAHKISRLVGGRAIHAASPENVSGTRRREQTHTTDVQTSPAAIDETVTEGQLVYHVIENLSPGMIVPVVIHGEDGDRRVSMMKWGLIPHYSPRSEKPDHYKIFNKRIESIQQSNKYFDKLAQSKRCLVVLDGFYEWKGVPGSKQPYYVHLHNTAMVMPAIYEETTVTDSDSSEHRVLRSFAIMTGEPSRGFRQIHERQPVIIDDQQAERWLNPDESAYSLLQEFKHNASDESFQKSWPIAFYPVSKKMTNAKYQESDCSTATTVTGDILSHFVKKEDVIGEGMGKRSRSPKRLSPPSKSIKQSK